MPRDVGVGDLRLGDGLGEELEGALEVRGGDVQDGLEPGQRHLDAEAGPLGLEQLGELLARVRPRALVEGAGRDGGDALEVAVLAVERGVEHEVRGHDVLAGQVEADQLDAVAERAQHRFRERPGAGRGDRGLRVGGPGQRALEAGAVGAAGGGAAVSGAHAEAFR